MRFVFRRADFGNDIILDEDFFQYKSFVRIGEEARRLIYCSVDFDGISEERTNYSSPKRYLWDKKTFDCQWKNLILVDDAYNVSDTTQISIPDLSMLFQNDGTFDANGLLNLGSICIDNTGCHYSRSSLMTFVYIEIFQQAILQINSPKYRSKWGNVNLRRYIRNVIITCPTAMPLSEQIYLRQSALDAFTALTICTPDLRGANIIPTPGILSNTDSFAPAGTRTWSYDEATCSQLVFLYAEIAQRYSGEIDKFFELKGHVRQDLQQQGYNKKSLTIATVDIGAGTTDVMICAYQYEGDGQTIVTPNPLFWDSYYLAGDDILRSIVQNYVIEGENRGLKDFGNISSALTARISDMSDAELANMPSVKSNVVYQQKINDILQTLNQEDKQSKKQEFASNLVHDFFGIDSSMMDFKSRLYRNDFNTQISVPIAQKMMDLLRLRRPSRIYTYDDLFSDLKPASFLLDAFEQHFGFRFEELQWRFDPEEIAGMVKSTIEPMMKQMSMLVFAHQCDIVVLSGRPTSLDVVTELFVKYVPVPPNRLVRLNDYRVGNWFPTADGQGYFYDQKSIVAAGAMVGYLAEKRELNGLVLDFSLMIKKMTSTANYVGLYNAKRRQVDKADLTPTNSTLQMNIAVFPAYIGCRCLNSSSYQARPIYAIYNHSGKSPLKIMISRNFYGDKELLVLEDAMDNNGNTIDLSNIELQPQSLADDGKFWLDKGEFELTINK